MNEFKGLQRPGQYVLQLMKPYLGIGHILTVDNFYTDLVLFKYLVENRTSCMGTIKKGRRLLPAAISKETFSKKRNTKGDIIWRYSEDFVAFRWFDKKDVRFLSSIQPEEPMNPDTKKPNLIHLYNAGMPGVDLADQKRHNRPVARNRLKRWYKKVFFHLLDISLVNSHVIMTHVPSFQSMTAEEFRLNLVKMITSKYGKQIDDLNLKPLSDNSLSRLEGLHYEWVRTKSRRCPVCSANNIVSRSRLACAKCDRNLCPPPASCWMVYHTQESLKH